MAAHLGHTQHRNAYFLMANTVLGAAAGLLFWLLFARLVGLTPAEVGVGYSIIALGTLVGVLAKGGLDTALVRTVPSASDAESRKLFGFAAAVGAGLALALALAFAALAWAGGWVPEVGLGGWAMVAALAVFLVVTWLQDAYFLGEGDARPSFDRNLVFHGARLMFPMAIVGLALPQPVSMTWLFALVVSSVAAAAAIHRIQARPGRLVPRREFLRSALRNVSGSAAEFLPGMLLVPVVLALEGAAAAAYFGIAWTGASLLFLASAAVSRSALAELARNGHHAPRHAIRRAVFQHTWTVLPAAIVGLVFAPQFLSVFGPAYATEGALVLAILCASSVVVAPFYLYLAYLRAREAPLALVAFPAAMILALAVLVYPLEARLGLAGVGLAWVFANIPFGLFAAWKLRRLSREVSPHEPARTVSGRPHVE